MQLWPIRDNVIIEPRRDTDSNVSRCGIFLPEKRKEGGMTAGVVLAVGPKVKEKETILPGSLVYFDQRFCGQEVVLGDGKKVLVMKEGDVIGVEVKI